MAQSIPTISIPASSPHGADFSPLTWLATSLPTGLRHNEGRPLRTGSVAHPLYQHVGLSESDIDQRRRGNASSYIDRAEAELFVSLTLDVNRQAIAEWLKDPTQPDRESFLSYCPNRRVGYGKRRVLGNDIICTNYNRVWLEKDATTPSGFKIVTAYPDLTIPNPLTPYSTVRFDPSNEAAVKAVIYRPSGTPRPDIETLSVSGLAKNTLYSVAGAAAVAASALTPSISDAAQPLAYNVAQERMIQQTPEQQISAALTSQGTPKLIVSWKPTARVARREEAIETFYESQQLPGGVIVNPGKAEGVRFGTLELSSTEPGVLLLDGRRYESGLSYEEMYLLVNIARGKGRVAATSLTHVEGTRATDLVGATLRRVDYHLGEIVFAKSDRSAASTLPELLALPESDLAEKLRRHFLATSAVTALRFERPTFRVDGRSVELAASPISVHLLPFSCATNAPRFEVEDSTLRRAYRREYDAVDDLAKSPDQLVRASPLFGRVAQYAAVLALLNQAVDQKVAIKNFESFAEIFAQNGSTISEVADRKPSVSLPPADTAAIEAALVRNCTDEEYLRRVAAVFLHDVARAGKNLDVIRSAVSAALAESPPTPGKDSEDTALFRRLTCAIALGAFPASSGRSQVSFEEGTQCLRDLLRDQKIEKVLDTLEGMRLVTHRPSANLDSDSRAFARTIAGLCDLGYGLQVTRILSERLVEIAAGDVADLACVDRGVMLALQHCVNTYDATSVSEHWRQFEEHVDPTRADFLRAVLLGGLKANEPASATSNRTPREIVQEIHLSSARGREHWPGLGVSRRDLDLIDGFLQYCRASDRSFDWRSFASEKQVPHLKIGTSTQMAGLARLDEEQRLLTAFGRTTREECESVRRKYDLLVKGCTAFVRTEIPQLREGATPDPAKLSDVFMVAGSFIYRGFKLKSGDVGSLHQGLLSGVLDCDNASHLYADVLGALGFNPVMCLSQGHAHLRVGSTHFEARGGMLISHAIALDDYGRMWDVNLESAARGLGAMEGLHACYRPLDREAFNTAVNLIEFGGHSGPALGLEKSGSGRTLTEQQRGAVLGAVRSMLTTLPHDRHALSHAQHYADLLYFDKAIDRREHESLSQQIGTAAFRTMQTSGIDEVLLPLVNRQFEHLVLPPEQKVDLDRSLRALGCNRVVRTAQGAITSNEYDALLVQKMRRSTFQTAAMAGTVRTRLLEAIVQERPIDDTLKTASFIVEQSNASDPSRIHVVWAWAERGSYDKRAAAQAAYRFLDTERRLDLGKRWADLLKRDGAHNDVLAVNRACTVLSLFGEEEAVRRFHAGMREEDRPFATTVIDNLAKQARDGMYRYGHLLRIFADGGYRSAGATLTFLELRGQLGHLGQSELSRLRDKVKKDGASWALACEIAFSGDHKALITASRPVMEHSALAQRRFDDVETVWRSFGSSNLAGRPDFGKLRILSEAAKRRSSLDSEWLAENASEVLDAANAWPESELSLLARYAVAEDSARIDGGSEIQRWFRNPNLCEQAKIGHLEASGRVEEAYSKLCMLEKTTDSPFLPNLRARLLRRMYGYSKGDGVDELNADARMSLLGRLSKEQSLAVAPERDIAIEAIEQLAATSRGLIRTVRAMRTSEDPRSLYLPAPLVTAVQEAATRYEKHVLDSARTVADISRGCRELQNISDTVTRKLTPWLPSYHSLDEEELPAMLETMVTVVKRNMKFTQETSV